MFTGLVEATVAVRDTTVPPGGSTAGPLRLELDDPWATTQRAGEWVGAGDSVAVDGVCLTALPRERHHPVLAFDVGHETLQRTTLGTLEAGARVHLERALSFGARLGGHLVSGHVDAVGRVVARELRGGSLYLGVVPSAEVLALSAAQGSVTLAGVSLTITSIDRVPGAGTALWVCLVPHTLERTHLGSLRVGDPINCEADLLARYLQRLVHAHPFAPPAPGAVPAADRATP